jgi:hypothetical protein
LTSSRIFIVVLILFAILFAISMGLGFRQNDSMPAANNVNPPGWISSISEWLSPTLDLKTVQGPCIEPAQKMITLKPGSTCTLQIPSSTDKYRKAQLHLVSGSSLALNYQSSTNDPNLSHQQLSWPGKDPQSLVVLAGGGSVAISCGSAAPCQLQAQ